MTSAEYVSQVNRLMDLQNNYFTIFIAILAITLGFLGILQWRITDKQIDKIKNEIHESIYRQYRDDFELSTSKIKQLHLDSLRITTFSSIDSVIMTDLRTHLIPKKISSLLKLIDELDIISEEETILLVTCVDRIMTRLQTKDSLNSARNMDIDCSSAYPHLREIMIFIETKSDQTYLRMEHYEDTILSEFLDFESKYNSEKK